MTKRRRHSAEDYTVVWVCALPVELAAAQEMLDETHDGFENHGPDGIYTLGRIAGHNVVIACLPKGQMGTNSAATATARLQSLYPAIRFAFLVGIGGGVPSVKADIRLGDVVVGFPEKTHGGVVQYDFGKATPTGLQRIGHLNAPPKILLEAVAKVQASYLRGQAMLHMYIAHFRSVPGFELPNSEQDVLFKAEYEHAGGETCKDCDTDRMIQRDPRENGIAVHYGTIASGNLVMRSGTQRDYISSELDSVLCFEMEAAGMMNTLGCIVIRGICDYADSHKNKEWQPYASATAVAYAKELLTVIPPASVAKGRAAEDIFKEKQANQETLSRLPYVAEATYSSYQRQHERTCLDNTRSQVLGEINQWADRQDGASIFWLNGWAGIGKSTIARTIARQYHDKQRLGASFFFSRGGGDTGHAAKFVTTIARQLANHILPLQSFICEAIEACVDIGSLSLSDQWRQLVVRSLSKIADKSILLPFIIVVDALDECDDDRNIRIILQLLSEAQLASLNLIRVFITSRPILPIELEISSIPQEYRCGLVLHHLPSEALHHDISFYLQHELRIIAQTLALSSSWPSSATVEFLAAKSNGLFIWCATACRFIDEGGPFAEERLNILVQGGSSSTGPEESLNEIYTSVLRSVVSVTYTDQEQKRLYGLVKQVLGAIVLLSSPLPLESLCKLLQIQIQSASYMLRKLHAILDIPRDLGRSIRLHHPSFRDYLLDKARCNDANFWVDEQETHHELAHCCLQLMNLSLREDICGLGNHGASVDEVDEFRLQQGILSEVRYACLFWVQHLQKSNAPLKDNDAVHQFLSSHILHWLEALGWMRRVPEGIRAILSLESMALENDCPRLYEFIWDARRLARVNKAILEEAPLQIYFSGLLFAPSQSPIRVTFQDRLCRWMKKVPSLQNHWSPHEQTLELEPGGDWYIIFSPDGKVLASTSGSTVRLWDTSTGECLHLLQPPSQPESLSPVSSQGNPCNEFGDGWTISDAFSSIAFSSAGDMLASKFENMVLLWDVTTGQCLGTLQGHTLPVNQVAFSFDREILASTSSDKTVRLWDPVTRQCLSILEGHAGRVTAVAFSPAPYQPYQPITLASASIDRTIRIWDALAGRCLHILETNTALICTLVFSSDGKMLVSACGNKTNIVYVEVDLSAVQLWNPSTGHCLLTLEGHTGAVTAVAFSPDSNILASSSPDATIRLWNPITGECLRVLEHNAEVHDIAFSPDGNMLASATWYHGDTVRLWNPHDGMLLRVLSGHTSWVSTVAFSPSSHHGKTVLASGSWDDTVLIWDATSVQGPDADQNGRDEANYISTSPDRRKIASAKNDMIRIWDISSGKCLQELKWHATSPQTLDFVSNESVKFYSYHNNVRKRTLWNLSTGECRDCPSDSQVLSIDHETMKIRDRSTGKCLLTLNDCTGEIRKANLSPDGTKVVLQVGQIVQVWDISSGLCLQTISLNTRLTCWSIFSSDSTKLVVTDDKVLYLWNLSSGDLQALTGHANEVAEVEFTHNGSIVASSSGDPFVNWLYSRSASLDNSLRLWNTLTGECLCELKDIPGITSLSFPADNQSLVTNLGALSLNQSGDRFEMESPGLFVRRRWITYKGRNMLWLPSEYRPLYTAVCDNVIILVCGSGQMLFLDFALD
ncbi:hypothetical protein BDW74DRAFT_172659 [Aspergillus multicolor]|uniref:uncharacterized protein n=1 Tax=Aspergillus multicolor TaxID=41759 RepID=UPI003CCCBF72